MGNEDPQTSTFGSGCEIFFYPGALLNRKQKNACSPQPWVNCAGSVSICANRSVVAVPYQSGAAPVPTALTAGWLEAPSPRLWATPQCRGWICYGLCGERRCVCLCGGLPVQGYTMSVLSLYCSGCTLCELSL